MSKLSFNFNALLQKPRLNTIFCIVFSLFIIHPFSAQALDWGKVEFDRVEEGRIYFKAPAGIPVPSPLKTNLFELAYQGVLHGDEAVPSYFVFTGKNCENCPQEKAVYIVRGSGGRVDSFVYPGKIIDPKTRASLVETRAFVGRCLNRVPGDVYVVFQKERIDRRRFLQASLFVAQAGQSHLDERLVERRLPNLNETLARVKRKLCREIDGRNRLMLSKPINLHPTQPGKDDDEDDDEPAPEAGVVPGAAAPEGSNAAPTGESTEKPATP